MGASWNQDTQLATLAIVMTDGDNSLKVLDFWEFDMVPTINTVELHAIAAVYKELLTRHQQRLPDEPA